ncbi:unnamed protein product [Didymodactylos carnosus]|uniref:AMP-dependent synthetase/ligase domain-containing protein n=1 Tax=Didymodactylos carnosus TaxID=1234261 RepID=A0A8S2F602_9BILA|nr:unnamed protein product [Didymodactylos carnosus]CAF4148276.1 unnamed protein product [Didymodactylos carnosus]
MDISAARNHWRELRTARLIWSTGDPLTSYSLSKLLKNIPFLQCQNFYGATECTVESIYHTVTASDLDEQQLHNNIPCGKPITNERVYVLDDYLQLVSVGREGKIYLDENIIYTTKGVQLMNDLPTSVAQRALRKRYGSIAQSCRIHQHIIELFGRYPHRNQVLSRQSTHDEETYLKTARNEFVNSVNSIKPQPTPEVNDIFKNPIIVQHQGGHFTPNEWPNARTDHYLFDDILLLIGYKRTTFLNPDPETDGKTFFHYWTLLYLKKPDEMLEYLDTIPKYGSWADLKTPVVCADKMKTIEQKEWFRKATALMR